MVTENKRNLGHYQLLKEIAMGGCGLIYLAQDNSKNGLKVIVKKLREEYIFDRDFIHLLRSEAETLAHLNHPNVIRVYEFVSEGENHYAVLEFVEGPTLREILDQLDAKKKSLPFPIALGITHQLVTALSYIHSASDQKGNPLHIIHSDLNPKNILINKAGMIKLIDFSIAQTAENKLGDTAGVGRGLITYMSPEQANSEPIDVRSDVFSVGILLHEMLVGEIPFPGKTRFEVYCSLMKKEISPEKLPDSIDEELKKILIRALSKKPNDRYQTMENMKKELENYMEKHNIAFKSPAIASYLAQLIP